MGSATAKFVCCGTSVGSAVGGSTGAVRAGPSVFGESLSQNSIGVAVIGAGMAGKAHAAAYRNAPTLYDSVLPPIRLVSIADVYEPAAKAAAERFGYERYDTSWQAIVDADDIDRLLAALTTIVAGR